MRTQLPLFIKAWFALDLFVALCPPLHWWASGAEPVLGMPRALLYLYGLSSFVALSVVAAYFCDQSLRRREAGGR